MLVESCIESSFCHCGISVKLVQDCLIARKHRESCFSGCPVELVEAGIVYTTVEVV